MVYVDAVDSESKLNPLNQRMRVEKRDTYHRRPTTISGILFVHSLNALRTMQTKQIVVELSYDTFRLQKVIE